MSQYANIKDLINRAGGDEVVQRGLSSLRATYRQEVPTADDLVDSVSDPRPDDIALCALDGLLYLYGGETWSAIGAPKITDALIDASALADDYLRGRYTLPLPGVPRTLVLVVCDLARWNLYDDAVTEIVEKRYKEAVAWLVKVNKGEIPLDGIDAPVVTGGTHSANISGPGRIFSRDSMRDL